MGHGLSVCAVALVTAGMMSSGFARDGNPAAPAAGAHPSPLIVIGKTANYRQGAGGQISRLNYHFFAEIFRGEDTAAGKGTLTDPHGKLTPFKGSGSVLGIPATVDYTSLAAMNADVPDGNYIVQYSESGRKPLRAALGVHGDAQAFAPAPRITLMQAGKAVAGDAIDPARDLVIQWSRFSTGRADPNGISDDLIFVHVGDCHGKLIAHTPSPLSGQPPLTYRENSYGVPASTLQAGQTYQVSVEHAPLTSSRIGPAAALVTYPSTTFLDFRTLGAGNNTCPDMPIRMDNGQSDRPAIGPTSEAARTGEEVRFFVIVKSSNYAQNATGELKLLNYHFFSEVFPSRGVQLTGELRMPGAAAGKPYVKREGTLYVEGGHFKSQSELDRAYPNGRYRISLQGPRTRVKDAELNVSGPDGRTDIPAPIHISLEQDGRTISPILIDSARPTTIRWTAFSNGRRDPQKIVDDMIFVVVQDCHGKRIFHTGLPFDGPYLRYDARQVFLPGNFLKPGQPYAMFVEMPHVADSIRAGDVPGFASYATATYLDLRTSGASTESCPRIPPAMDTGQTDRPGSG